MRLRPAAFIPLLIALVTGLVLAVSLPATAAAAKTPCWKKVLNDWSRGRPIGTYPLHCYRDAIRHLPEDLRDYSSAADDIQAALQAQIAKRNTRSTQGIGGSDSSSNSGSGSGSSSHNGGGGTPTGGSGGGGGGGAQPAQSAYRRAIDNLGTSNADTLPVPLIVLASVGGALLLLAAAMTATKRVRARRAPPA